MGILLDRHIGCIGMDGKSIEVYQFKHFPYVVDGEAILDAVKQGRSTSITGASLEARSGRYLYISFQEESCSLEIELDKEDLKRIDGTYLYKVECGKPLAGLKPLALYTEHGFMRLYKPVGSRYTTLMINGILMHQTVKLTPIEDAKRKIMLASIQKGHLVLDVCTGLGYTAIAARQRGARVYTIEVSRHVLSLAAHNPYSRLLEDTGIHIINNDATRIISLLEDSVFHRIVHDPPRFSVAGELYSESFYAELYRVLKPGGFLVHYVGRPMKTRGRGYGPIVRGVIERLRRVGFTSLRYAEDVGAIVAKKTGRLY